VALQQALELVPAWAPELAQVPVLAPRRLAKRVSQPNSTSSIPRQQTGHAGRKGGQL